MNNRAICTFSSLAGTQNQELVVDFWEQKATYDINNSLVEQTIMMECYSSKMLDNFSFDNIYSVVINTGILQKKYSGLSLVLNENEYYGPIQKYRLKLKFKYEYGE